MKPALSASPLTSTTFPWTSAAMPVVPSKRVVPSAFTVWPITLKLPAAASTAADRAFEIVGGRDAAGCGAVAFHRDFHADPEIGFARRIVIDRHCGAAGIKLYAVHEYAAETGDDTPADVASRESVRAPASAACVEYNCQSKHQATCCKYDLFCIHDLPPYNN
jgi:hypothetical protein